MSRGPEDRRRRRKLLLVAMALGSILLVTEASCRVLWWWQGVPFLTSPSQIHLAFYPALRELEPRIIQRDETYDVLLLGGSVISEEFSSIGEQLAERLAFEYRKPARVFNLGAKAHTTLDSYYKYRHLRDKRFDLVVVYHGINEIRTNNCPPEMFRDDYSHYGWYEKVNDAESMANSVSSIPYSLSFAFTTLTELLGLRSFVPTHDPQPEWVALGENVKSAGPFRKNIEAICELAEERGEPVLLLTFAIHVPEDYSLEKFRRRELDYSTHFCAIELWGKVANVIKAIAIHNDIVRDVAQGRAGAHLLDQAKELPRGGRVFNDVCHLTHVGSTRFVDNLMRAIEELGLGP